MVFRILEDLHGYRSEGIHRCLDEPEMKDR